MPKKLIYAGIGSRETPSDMLKIMESIAFQLADRWILRSGHATGADTAFESGCLKRALETKTEPNMEIYLPWKGFNNAPLSKHYYVLNETQQLREIAANFHPSWARCNDNAKKFHMRNVYQVAGYNLNTQADMVVCWTPDAKWTGGTAQALRIADWLGVPIFNLADERNWTKLDAFINDIEGVKKYITCPDCENQVPLRICKTPAGFYLGYFCCNCGPIERISDYYPSREDAQKQLDQI